MRINLRKYLGNSENSVADVKFYFNDNTNLDRNYDFWFIIDDINLKDDTAVVNPDQIFFFTAEQIFNLDHYFSHSKFLCQFKKFFSNYPLPVAQYKFDFPFLPWMIDSNHGISIFTDSSIDSEFLATNSPVKTKRVAVICSNKHYTPGHRLRLKFLEKLISSHSDLIDWFGNGVDSINSKYEAIAPYNYQLVLENVSRTSSISEKLYDSYLGESFPIYWGAPNVNSFFPVNSFQTINLLDFDSSIYKILSLVNSNLDSATYDSILSAKQSVLTKYNLFVRLAEIAKREYLSSPKMRLIRLKPKKYFSKYILTSRFKNIFI